MAGDTTEPRGLGVYRAVNAVQKALSVNGIAKERKNQQQGYNFRGIDEVYNELCGLLAAHHLCIFPRVLGREVVERQTKAGGVMFYVVCDVELDFVCSDDGSTKTVRLFGEAMDSGDKATNKSMSAAYKYACLEVFCIPTKGDNDADATTHEIAPSRQQRRPPAKANGQKPSNAEMNKELGDRFDGGAAVDHEAAERGVPAIAKIAEAKWRKLSDAEKKSKLDEYLTLVKRRFDEKKITGDEYGHLCKIFTGHTDPVPAVQTFDDKGLPTNGVPI